MRHLLLLVLVFTAVLAVHAQPQRTDSVFTAALVQEQGTASGDVEAELDRLKRQVGALSAQLDTLTKMQEGAAPRRVDRIDVSGTVFANYGWNYSGTGAAKNDTRFLVDRLYLTVRGKLSETLRFRGTTDIYASGVDADLSPVVILKYAYLDWTVASWLMVRGGVIPTAWSAHVNAAWGYRGVAKVLTDLEKMQPAADVGLSLRAELREGLGHVVVGVQNGAGYRQLEADRFKDVSAHLVLRPLRKGPTALQPIQVSGHVYDGRHPNEDRRTRWGGMLYYPSSMFSVGANYDARRDSTVAGAGVSVFGELKLGRGAVLQRFSVVGRWVAYDPDTAVSNNVRRYVVMGLAYKPTSKMTLVVNTRRATQHTASFERYDGTFTHYQGRVALHAIVFF